MPDTTVNYGFRIPKADGSDYQNEDDLRVPFIAIDAQLKTMAKEGAWTPYVPVLTASVTNPNIGSTGTIVGAYQRLTERTIAYRIVITASGVGVTPGSGNYQITIPTIPTSPQILGLGWIYGTGGFKPFVVDSQGSASMRLIRMDTGTVVDHTIGFSVSGNVTEISGTYESLA